MKSFSPLLTFSLAAAVLSSGAGSVATAEEAEPGAWFTDFALAQETAKREGKDLFLNFTGSDWCGFCIALHDQVMTKSEFTEPARKGFVLVELDFPKHKPQTDELKSQNELLRRKFAIKGYPTLLLADFEGRAYAQIPNQPGLSAEQLATQIDSLKNIRERRDKLVKEAEKLEGMERAEKLNDALDSIDDELVGRFQSEIVDQIIELDEKDTLKRKSQRTFSKAMIELESLVQALGQVDDHDGIAMAIDEFIEKKKLKGEKQQRALMLKLGLYGADKLEAAVK
ncbi:MAG: thioredoxin family protein, partial [Verrucomicrobiae bacterium]|nr:thioredoxin family protein [Verrucomicrobiae bacterium]